MKMPTAVDQLPSFSSGGTVSSQPGSNNLMAYLIAGGVIIVGVGILVAVNRKIQRDRMKGTMQENDIT